MSELISRLWVEDAGQDIAEYAVMLAVILVLVVGTIRLIGSNANNVFSNVGSHTRSDSHSRFSPSTAVGQTANWKRT